MAQLLSPRLLRRGLEVFAAISAVGFVGLLFYGNNFQQFLGTMGSLHWGWVLAGVALASMDWFGAGLRIWILARHLDPKAPFKGSIMAGGLCSWASSLTPLQTGGGPMIVLTLRRYGTPVSHGVIVTFMSFVATVVFFAVAGPTAVFLGAGKALQQHGILERSVTLFDMFNLSLSVFVGVGILMFAAFFFPGLARRVAQGATRWFETHGSPRLARAAVIAREGVDRAHDGMNEFMKARGWLALGMSVLVSGPSHANKLLAGYFVLRMLGIHANFVDVLLLQTFITFLLYFAPTPGGAGLAEIISVAVMSIYVPRALTPSYILLWRIVVSYLTVGFGSYVFWRFLKMAEGRDDAPLEEQTVPI
ncbi:MAG: flippase-like domain-containing protein [Gemmatimonadetes bacterium]|nr:flippase-like domain-containing protein [Gemmatimonadota bacterium]